MQFRTRRTFLATSIAAMVATAGCLDRIAGDDVAFPDGFDEDGIPDIDGLIGDHSAMAALESVSATLSTTRTGTFDAGSIEEDTAVSFDDERRIDNWVSGEHQLHEFYAEATRYRLDQLSTDRPVSIRYDGAAFDDELPFATRLDAFLSGASFTLEEHGNGLLTYIATKSDLDDDHWLWDQPDHGLDVPI